MSNSNVKINYNNIDKSEYRPSQIVDGRPLSSSDLRFFEKKYGPLSSVTAYPKKAIGSNQNIEGAFHQAIKMSPMLQTRIEGDGPSAVFRHNHDPRDWPTIVFEPEQQTTNDRAMALARKRNIEHLDRLAGIDGNNPDVEHRKSLRTNIVRGPTWVVFSFVCPHQFTDGRAAISLMFKLLLFYRFPKFMWKFLSKYCLDTNFPSLTEMALKDQIHLLQGNVNKIEKLISTSPSLPPIPARSLVENASSTPSPRFFGFPNYDPFDPASALKLNGLPLETVGILTDKDVKNVECNFATKESH